MASKLQKTEMDNVFHMRSAGAAAEGVRDQYADGRAARVWEAFIGDKNSRTQNYRNFLVGLLRKNGCQRILDVACGTGIDSIMLLEEGFEVTSVDASDKMLKYALRARWNRRKEPAFDKWVIEEANWLTLADDIADLVGDGFDAVICLGNSFAHLPDVTGDQRDQKKALENFKKCVKRGGLLLIDHRNYDDILETGKTPKHCLYYNSKRTTEIVTSVLYVEAKPTVVTLDYLLDMSDEKEKNVQNGVTPDDTIARFRLSYYPHRLEVFKRMLQDVFGAKSEHTLYGDFKQLHEIDNPAFYIHVVQKAFI
ncbi:glycine N-methyltransferase isoform X1 [Schistocerca gregaria]|uniref:glycine N-methyltransferase isoform X1 n=2 Tax=Schistocerca gregaria TaxID=7010 RepID=UPI00211E319E|nr:glycine N-methyltransferase isoform X1 [Schistocerca gregaria]